MKWKKILLIDLKNTKIGYVLLGCLAPLWLIYFGLCGIIHQELTIRYFTYSGFTAQTMGTAAILSGIALFWGWTPKLKDKYYVNSTLYTLSAILIIYSVYKNI